jgi:hypothetical protein
MALAMSLAKLSGKFLLMEDLFSERAKSCQDLIIFYVSSFLPMINIVGYNL